MDQTLAVRVTNEILAAVAARYQVRPEQIHKLQGNESFIYEYDTPDGLRILRLSHSSRRPHAQVAAEVDWIRHLVAGGVSAAEATASANGQLTEVIELPDQTHFTAVSFRKAAGHHPRSADRTPELHRQMGRLMGRMHALTKRYVPSNQLHRRPYWDREIAGMAEKYLPPEDADVLVKWHELLEKLHALPTPDDAFGLVHIDMHPGNFFVDRGQITLFDFDDCQYAWYINDIAMALFYAVPHHCETMEQVADAKSFLRDFLAGYREDNTLDPSWLRYIADFLKFRELDLFININRHFANRPLDDWGKSFMHNRKHKILHDVPYIDLAFDQF